MAFDQAIADRICERLTRESMRRICSDQDMPDRGTVERWIQQDPEFAAKCARARVIQADHVFDGMESLEEQVLSGEVDAHSAKVVLSSRQWRLSKMLPKYGEKVDVNHAGTMNVKLDTGDGGIL